MIDITPADLEAMKVDVSGKNEAELIQLGLHLYDEECVAASVEGKTFTHDGIKIYIYPRQFDHAFYDARIPSERGIRKDCIDSGRIERVRWIIPIVAGQVENTECWEITDRHAYKKPPPVQRLYVYKSDLYLIWLRTRKDGAFYFSSAYSPGWKYFQEQIVRQRKIWAR